MKTLTKTMLNCAILLYSIEIIAQNPPLPPGFTSVVACPPPTYHDYHIYPGIDTNFAECAAFRQAFVPAPNDRVLTVNLTFHVFNDDNGNGWFSTTTQANIDSAVNQLNVIYSNIMAATDPVAGTPLIGDTKIRFRKKAAYISNLTFGYEYFYAPNTTFNNSITDCNTIHIIFCKLDPAQATGAATRHSPGKHIFMAADQQYNAGNVRTPNEPNTLSALAHELGHALGMAHTLDAEQKSPAKLDWGPGVYSTCPYLVVNDAHHTSPAMHGGNEMCNYSGDPNFIPTKSNNIMSNNIGCRRYLSPGQMALMHFHLRTDMKSVLSDSSYVAAVSVDHNFDYTVTNADTWMYDRYMKGDLIIDSGAVLAVYGNVAMTRNARVIIKPGGQLNIVTGRFCNLSGEVWSGIQVGGRYNKPQAMTSNGFALYQGVLRMSHPNATITHAENAVKNCLTDQNFVPQWQTTGGIIVANQGNFINNVRDVEFLNYMYPSASTFIKCNFHITGEIGLDAIGNPALPATRVTMWNIEGVKFRNCDFKYSAGALYSDPGTGIGTLDAVFSIDKTTGDSTRFQNFRQAIVAASSNPLKIPSINNARFYNNTLDAVYLSNLRHVQFSGNLLRTKQSNGLYLSNCRDYMIKNNTFTDVTGNQVSTGIYAFNSVDGNHNIYRNVFSKLKAGISTIGNNSALSNVTNGLKMNCNDFSQVKNDFDIAMYKSMGAVIIPPTVMVDQGLTSYPQQFVRNIYGALSDCNTCENQWWIDNSPRIIQHPSFANQSSKPTPQPDLSDPNVNVINSATSFDFGMFCPLNPPSTGGTVVGNSGSSALLANTYTYLNDLKSVSPEKQNVFEIGATVSTQLNLFLTDSLLNNKDSVIALLSDSRGNYVEDRDVLTVYAYMLKDDLVAAQAKADAIANSKPVWAEILNKQIALAGNPSSFYNLSEADISFFSAYAAYDSIDGTGPARAILYSKKIITTDQRPLPPDMSGARIAQYESPELPTYEKLTVRKLRLDVYPNPANNYVTVKFTAEKETTVRLDMVDALGRSVYTGQVKAGSQIELSLNELPNGIYILNAYENNTKVNQVKVVCIK